ncbi:hypothetical protein J2W43_005158 [Pseudomonas brassicacearum]|uniref:Uncharacterized protein n=1 Tax=Pseudomonas brassicacearum TaxID=930166 RepID=A0AAW8MHH9_9PSED|nr:hypothetical protein [Pseudomonas brassicacearum]
MPEPHQSNRETCGSELARESGVSDNINVDCYAVFASKLAPTGVSFDWRVSGTGALKKVLQMLTVYHL